ncbi:putative kinase [Variovorax paradoxus]|nr:putative kinase [Variovorax paradoxus]
MACGLARGQSSQKQPAPMRRVFFLPPGAPQPYWRLECLKSKLRRLPAPCPCQRSCTWFAERSGLESRRSPKRLAAEPKTVLISEDDWLARLYPNEIHAIADYVRCAGRLREAMAGHITALLAAGTSVVLDFSSNTTTTRSWARGVFEKAGAAHRLHYLEVPEEVCKARLRVRNLSGEHPFQTTDAEFDQITSHCIPPGAEEGFNIVRYG